jgi:hypothetical protein
LRTSIDRPVYDTYPALLHPLAPFVIDRMHASQIFQVNNCLQGNVALRAPIEWHNDPQTNLPHKTHNSGPASTRTSDMDAATAKLISFPDPEEPLVPGRPLPEAIAAALDVQRSRRQHGAFRATRRQDRGCGITQIFHVRSNP